MAASLQTEESRRNPATNDWRHHDGDIDLHFFIGFDASDLFIQDYDPNTVDPSHQNPDHAFEPPTQFILHTSFRTTTTFQPMAKVLKNC
jgi:hypothetical protein